MSAFNDTERLDWVLCRRPEFGDGYLRVWLGAISALDLGFPCREGFFMAEGDTPRECLDNAMSGKLQRMD